jgi:hypothetical protein
VLPGSKFYTSLEAGSQAAGLTRCCIVLLAERCGLDLDQRSRSVVVGGRRAGEQDAVTGGA